MRLGYIILGTIISFALGAGCLQQVAAGGEQSTLGSHSFTPSGKPIIGGKKFSKREKQQLSIDLINAAKHGHAREIDGLILMGADVNYTDQEGQAALRCAAQLGHAKVVEKLLSYGANVDQPNSENGNTALLWAATRGHKEIVGMLLANHADVNHANHYGNTPLIWAAKEGHTDVVTLLLFNGADPSYKNYDDNEKDALQWAAKKGHIETVGVISDFMLGKLTDPKFSKTKSARNK